MSAKPSYEELERQVQELKTDYTQLEKKLLEARSLTDEIITHMAEGLVLTDARGIVIFINQRLSKMLGYGAEEIIGKSWLDLVPADQQSIAKEAEVQRAQGHTARYEIILHRKNGETFPVLIGAGPRFDNHSREFIGTMSVVTDITEHKQAEEEIHQVRDQYQSLVENIPGIIYRCKCDTNWTMLFMSDAVDTLSGYPASDFIGNAVRTYESLIHLDDTALIEEIVNTAVAGGRPWDIEYRIHHKDGNIRWVHEKGRGRLFP